MRPTKERSLIYIKYAAKYSQLLERIETSQATPLSSRPAKGIIDFDIGDDDDDY